MFAQFLKDFCFALKETLANLPLFTMLAVRLEVLDQTLGVADDPRIFGHVGLPKCLDAQNLNDMVTPV